MINCVHPIIRLNAIILHIWINIKTSQITLHTDKDVNSNKSLHWISRCFCSFATQNKCTTQVTFNHCSIMFGVVVVLRANPTIAGLLFGYWKYIYKLYLLWMRSKNQNVNPCDICNSFFYPKNPVVVARMDKYIYLKSTL